MNRLPDGTWMAICRNDAGNYHFTTSQDGKTWTVGEQMPFVPNGLNSKPTFDKFGGVYYLGWQENTRIHGCNRSVFNVDISRDGQNVGAQIPLRDTALLPIPDLPRARGRDLAHRHAGRPHSAARIASCSASWKPWASSSRKQGRKRIAWPAPPPDEPAVMKRGVKLFTDREYVIDEMPDAVRDLPFLRTSIEKTDVDVTQPGTLLALTPTIRPNAASQEAALQQAGFTKVDVPEVQLFPGEINRVSLYRKEVKTGERLQFKKMVLMVLADGAALRDEDGIDAIGHPRPRAEFQDDARPAR